MGEVIPLFPLGSPLFPGVVLPLHVFEPRYRRLVHDLLALPGSERSFGVVAIRQGWEVERVAPAEALYDVGCTARLQVVRPQPDGGFHLVTVGGERFRLLDVLVGEEPPYLRAEVAWLADEEAAEEVAGAREGPAEPATGGQLDEVASAVARGSLEVLVRSVSDLFGRYVAEVATLRGEGWDDEEDVDALGEAQGGGRDAALSGRPSALLRGVVGDPRALSWLVASAALLTTEDRQALLAVSGTRRRLTAESRLLRRELTLLQTLGAVPVPLQQFATPMTVN